MATQPEIDAHELADMTARAVSFLALVEDESNPLTNDRLSVLIQEDPEHYSMFKPWLGLLPYRFPGAAPR